MDKFVVPQFLDTEGKIVGPITVRQFLVLMVDAGLIFLCYKFLSVYFFIGFGAILLALGIIIAFVKINGRPIQYFLINIFESFRRPKLRVWQQIEIRETFKPLRKGLHKTEAPPPPHKPLPHSRLSSLSLMVDTGGRYQGETENVKVQSLDTLIE